MHKIEDEIIEIKRSIAKYSAMPDEYVFSFVCYKYFYNEGDFTTADEKDVFVDGKSDGGIDLVTISELPSNEKNLVLIQSKMITTLQNNQDIIDILTKMNQTYVNFRKSQTSTYNTKIRRILTGYIDELEDQSFNVELVIFLNVSLGDRKNKILEEIQHIEELSNYQISIYDKNEIESQIEQIRSPKRFVHTARIKISKESGTLSYDEGKGILVNIYASSLKRLYEMYKNEGLFEQNFRYFIKQKTIDDEIKRSIKNKKSMFWYLNNGIIIGCNSFVPDGSNIVLNDFSIINGCQTTTLIGETDGITDENDFLIHCKIIAGEREGKDVEISEVAAASNSQKPIGVRDLKANKPEQIRIKKDLQNLNPPIYMEIKRGEEKRRTTNKWQNISNEYYAQLIASFVYQIPGTCRSLKAKLFQDDSIYNKVFRNNHTPMLSSQLIQLAYDYDSYKKEYSTNDPVDEAIISQGKFIFIALIGFFIKYFRGQIDLTKIKKDSEDWVQEISQNSITRLYGENYQFDETIDQKKTALIQVISYELKNIYEIRYNKNEETSVSNFFKRDKRYQDIILEHFKRRLIDNPMEKEKFHAYLSIFDI